MAVGSKNLIATSESEIHHELNLAEVRKKPSWLPWRASGKSQHNRADWRPRSLRPAFLMLVIAASLALIAVLQYLLVRSERDNGIIFADDITALPLSRSFPYLYLPTIIAVVYGFAWTWIDLDVRRMEPFYQLAKEGGAPAHESLLLSYPVDFVASVPLKALRYRHWSPFIASFATVFVFWGLTPSQAGIFATSTVNQTTVISTAHSTTHLSLDQQSGSLSAKAANSVSSIIWLNETLQPFMTRDAMLAPFGPLKGMANLEHGILTGNTKQYFANVSCEDAIVWKDDDFYFLNSTWGCSTSAPSLRSRSILDESGDNKLFDTLYVGFYNIDGNAAYSLGNGRCPRDQSNSFMVQFSSPLVPAAEFMNMSTTEQRDNSQVTNLYCRSSYFIQDVRAAVQLPDRSVLAIEPRGIPEPLPSTFFNGSAFEASMSEGRDRFRTMFPSLEWPDQTSYLKDTELFLGFMSRMIPFAIGSTKVPMSSFLRPEVLQLSYQNAYRLLLARQMADILQPVIDNSTMSEGTIQKQFEAVIVVPTFVYIVEALLGISCLFAAIILYLSRSRSTKLVSDPASLAAIMSLSAESTSLLSLLKASDTSTAEQLEQKLATESFRLANARDGDIAYVIKHVGSQELAENEPCPSRTDTTGGRHQSTEESLPGVQPFELSLKVGTAFLGGLLVVFILLAFFWFRIQDQDGLALPSQDRFIRQLWQNYIPTGVATVIEPFWLLLNRNLCYLQPFEALRRQPDSGRKTIGLDYLSLPPQLVMIKASLRRHVLLATVCLMTLLANVLSIALSGLFFENTIQYPLTTDLEWSPALRFRALDGNGPLLANSTGDIVSPFYVATSNETADTPLPSWSDSGYLYRSFTAMDGEGNSSWALRATTDFVGASLDCQPLSAGSSFSVTGTAFDETGTANIPSHSNLTVVLHDKGVPITCLPRAQLVNGFSVNPEELFSVPTGKCQFEFAYALQAMNGSSDDEHKFCQEHLAAGWVHGQLMNGTKLPGTEHTSTQPSIVLSYSPFVMTCRSRIRSGTGRVTVDGSGKILNVDQRSEQDAKGSMFMSSPADVIGQAHRSILNSGREWHNDTNPSDFSNYLIAQSINSSRFLDPSAPLPTIDEAVAAFGPIYSKLFAIWLQQNRAVLFELDDEQRTIEGAYLQPQTRIFMSRTMFILSESILALYMLVTVILYSNRPWKILCRLPTTLASIIAYAAASRALRDLRGTAGLSHHDRIQHLNTLQTKYGFGSFIGVDNAPHVGIEKQPYVVKLMRAGTSSSVSVDIKDEKQAASNDLRNRFRHWKSMKAKEGGWL